MSHYLAIGFLRRFSAHNNLTETEYDNVCYFLEVLLINISKLVQIYLLAWICKTLIYTFMIQMSFSILRSQALGWHAKHSFSCSLLSIVSLVGLPWLVVTHNMVLNLPSCIGLAGFILILIWKYAPADTEKNPLINETSRRRKKIKAVSISMILIVISFMQPAPFYQTLILLGLLLEVISILPVTYTLTKRSYKNYEKYC